MVEERVHPITLRRRKILYVKDCSESQETPEIISPHDTTNVTHPQLTSMGLDSFLDLSILALHARLNQNRMGDDEN